MAWLVAEADGLNEDVLRYEIESGKHAGSPVRLAAAKVSLAKRSEARAQVALVKRDEREEETLSIARAANGIAQSAASTAAEALRTAKRERITAIIAAIAALAAALAAMYPLVKPYLYSQVRK